MLWECLRSISGQLQAPWIIGGDFNTLFNSNERLYGALPNNGAIEEFASIILNYGLMDAGYEGIQYTWANSCMFQSLNQVFYNM